MFPGIYVCVCACVSKSQPDSHNDVTPSNDSEPPPPQVPGLLHLCGRSKARPEGEGAREEMCSLGTPVDLFTLNLHILEASVLCAAAARTRSVPAKVQSERFDCTPSAI